MAEGFEPYHVPQQSRRDKLRVTTHHHHHPPPPPPHPVPDGFNPCSGLLPLYEPLLLLPDFTADAHRSAAAKAEGASLMAFLGGASAAHAFVNPNLSPQLNPSSVQDVNGGGPYAFPSPTQCYQSFNPVQDPNATGQSLSLSLSSTHGGDLNLPPELNLQKYDFGPCRPGFGPIEFSKSTVPLGPFTGYAFVLKGSRFLRPAQQLLEELCDMGRVVCMDKIGPDPGLLDPPPLDNLTGVGIMDDSGDGGEQKKKSRLLSMLHEVIFFS
ncbi:BEL1-like homeodomain protein [Striga asiatica]|uniref:BEL1-like homeodomain protein n=1 Tax=Striga asiatica TaxID=4170 RepID=A0A5A7QMG2_STRAF|nr:BEL1-like homeodomain protein [Striga asiatica]